MGKVDENALAVHLFHHFPSESGQSFAWIASVPGGGVADCVVTEVTEGYVDNSEVFKSFDVFDVVSDPITVLQGDHEYFFAESFDGVCLGRGRG